MCGRFTLVSPQQAVKELLGEPAGKEFGTLVPRYNIAPGQEILAIRLATDGSGREAVRLRWGLVPAWAKESSVGNRLINARAETVAEKPSFRSAFRARRCLIAADGFFEWRGKSGAKTPYHIGLTHGGPFAMAGLWERWQAEGGPVIESCTIITTAANRLLEPIHPRMPVIVPIEHHHAWLGAGDTRQTQSLLLPYPSRSMKARQVSCAVNRADNDGPECIEPV